MKIILIINVNKSNFIIIKQSYLINLLEFYYEINLFKKIIIINKNFIIFIFILNNFPLSKYSNLFFIFFNNITIKSLLKKNSFNHTNIIRKN